MCEHEDYEIIDRTMHEDNTQGDYYLIGKCLECSVIIHEKYTFNGLSIEWFLFIIVYFIHSLLCARYY